MPNKNLLEIMGHLGRDPETRNTSSGKSVTSFSVAVSNNYKDQRTGEWVDKPSTWFKCTIWGDLGEEISSRYFKGDCIRVWGKVGLEEWEDKQSGEKKAGLAVNVFEVASPTYVKKDKSTEDERPRRKQSDDDFPMDISAAGDDADIPF